ncbi:hypothetical protein GE061_010201 [Apolygus lucorum]|uniref:EF-hand domain-containing protein n=1 Tax=Apolygus lucorum TaxID=248454 RepID=A0A6A4KJP5_APOLU|nr:hypothetical protein GE061_010201 [Apolygus lucorum]
MSEVPTTPEKQKGEDSLPSAQPVAAEHRPSSGRPSSANAEGGIRKSVATLDPQSQARADMMAELEKKVVEAFEIFDHAANKTVDVREVGTILRSLGCVPTEAEIQEIIVSVEDQESPGSVHLDRFLGHVVNIISEYKMQPASAEELLKAFQTLDLEGTGYITKDMMAVLMKEGSEPFTDEELEEMMGAAVEPGTDNINYELYINQIMGVRNELGSIYEMIPKPKKKKIEYKKLI